MPIPKSIHAVHSAGSVFIERSVIQGKVCCQNNQDFSTAYVNE